MISCQTSPGSAADVFNFQEGFFGAGFNDLIPAYIKQEPPSTYCPNMNKPPIHATHANGYNALSSVGYQQVSNVLFSAFGRPKVLPEFESHFSSF